MKVLSIMFLLLLGSYSVASQIITELVSAMPVVVNGKLVKPKGKSSISFPENGTSDRLQGRLPDLTYGSLGTKDEPDWFVVTGTYPNRTKMINLGPHRWENQIGFPPLEPYGELKPGESRQATVEFEIDDSIAVSSLISVAEATNGRTFMRPGKIVRTSSDIVKVIEGNMYLIRVRDNMYDFKVLLRVDKLSPGKSVTFSWRQLRYDATSWP